MLADVIILLLCRLALSALPLNAVFWSMISQNVSYRLCLKRKASQAVMIQILLSSLIEIVLCEYFSLVCKLCLNFVQMPFQRKCLKPNRPALYSNRRTSRITCSSNLLACVIPYVIIKKHFCFKSHLYMSVSYVFSSSYECLNK